MRFSFILCLLAIANGLSAQEGFVIKGDLKNLKDSTLVFLSNTQGNTISQDYSKNGKFELKGKLDEPELNILNFTGIKAGTEIFLGNENASIKGDIKNSKSISITGSKYQNEFQDYLTAFMPIKEKLEKTVGAINKEPKGKKRDSLIEVFNGTTLKVTDLVGQFIKAHPTSPVSAFILYAVNPLFQDKPGLLEEKFKGLKDAAKTSVYARMLEKLVDDAHVGMVGSMATDFEQNDTANKPVKLSSFRGKYVLVDFWASWCRPCRAENPNVLNAYNTYHNKNFTVMGVSLDKEKESWVKAINDDGLSWTQVSDLKSWSNAAAQLYKIQSIPSNMLIDPTGKIVGKNLRGEELQEKLKELLK